MGVDVCRALEIRNNRDAMERLDEDENCRRFNRHHSHKPKAKDGGVEQVLVTHVGIESLRLQKKLWDKRRRRDE